LLTPGIKELVVAQAPEAEIRAAAREDGMLTLREAGLQMVRAGATSIHEITRVAT
jgi:type II secretory ATPase GspE/PulE/Tfp pilus assembly ATPase PilB-like protein